MQEICELFKTIAADTWDLIARNNSRGTHIDERGITGINIIDVIQNYVERTGSNKIFAQRTKLEHERGADLEVFVEYEDSEYLRYLFQAKSLHSNIKYHDLNHRVNRDGPYQWDLLLNYSRIAQAIPRYIFYNGIKDYSYEGSDCCGYFNEKQYGCAIAEINPVKKYCTDNQTGHYPFLINSTPPPVGIPWRSIPCCATDRDTEMEIRNGNLKLYSRGDINMDKSFEKIFKIPPAISGPPREIEEETVIENLNDELYNMGWQPIGRIVVSKFGIKNGRVLRFYY